MHPPCLPFLPLFALLLGTAGPAGAEPTRVPGTRVTLDPPAGFQAARNYPGFVSEDGKAFLQVTEMPAPVQAVRQGLTAENMKKKGMALLQSTPHQHGGGESVLLEVRQSAGNQVFHKWMLVAGDEAHTTLVVATYPDPADRALGTALRQAVLSTTLSSASPQDPFEGLLFHIPPSDRFKLASRIGNMVMFTESGQTRLQSANEALVVVGNSYADVDLGDLAAFARDRARKTAQLRDLRVTGEGDSRLGDLPARELIADALDRRSGEAMRLFQLIAPEGKGYFIFQGLVAATRGDELLPEFRRVAAGFRRQ